MCQDYNLAIFQSQFGVSSVGYQKLAPGQEQLGALSNPRTEFRGCRKPCISGEALQWLTVVQKLQIS